MELSNQIRELKRDLAKLDKRQQVLQRRQLEIQFQLQGLQESSENTAHEIHALQRDKTHIEGKLDSITYMVDPGSDDARSIEDRFNCLWTEVED